MRHLNKRILLKLSSAALDNAQALLDEAETLLASEHFARAYFLALASIEEVGKSGIAFNAAGRNLGDPQVIKVTWNRLLDHKSKIIAAFGPSIALTEKGNLSEAIEASLELMGDLRRGREPSMYTEIRATGFIQKPKDVVRPVAARNAVRLAKHCLDRAQKHLPGKDPPATTEADDYFYTLTANKIQEVMAHPEFSAFYMERIKGGDIRLEEAMHAFVLRSPT